jgi:hypothetical protein
MRHIKNVLAVALVVFVMSLTVMAQTATVTPQTARRTDDPRNQAPAIGTGGSISGPTGLFTVYDGQTLRAGEFTFSAAFSNYDRDPGNVDITDVPLSFNVGINNYLELFFSTDAYRGVKVNSPRNLSGFSLPNSQVRIGTGFTSAPALVLAGPSFANTQFANRAVFRPQGRQPFVQFPYVGGSGGTGFGTLGPVRAGGGSDSFISPSADLFPGVGSTVGGILPGLVLQTTTAGGVTSPTTFTIAPSYLPDMPFLNRTWGESAFNTFNFGAKWRFTSPNSAFGLGVIPFIRYNLDKANDFAGFNQLQRGASPGGNRFEGGAIFFADARLARWANVSANAGYILNSSVKAEFPNGEFILLDRPDEVLLGAAVDFPVNKYFQPIGEIRATKYVAGRTPNALEQDPVDLLGGVRVYPQRWFGLSFAYRYNLNQQKDDVFDNDGNTTGPGSINGVPAGFLPSDDPHGFIVQFFAGRRNEREVPTKPNTPAVISNVTVSDSEIVLPTCPEGQKPREGSTACNDAASVNIATTATDADNDPLIYQYTVSGGRVTGTGANVAWDLTGVQPGTYTVSVGVDDGCGVCGQPVTREVRIVTCTDCVPIVVCPTDVRVAVDRELINEGETATFTASATLNNNNPAYNWTVSAGEIVSGQGTPTLVVRAAPGTGGSNITASVNFGNIDPTCQGLSGSATTQVVRPPVTELVDEYERLPADAEKARLDNAATRLQADPNARLFIIGYGGSGRRGGNAEAQRRINFVVNYLTRNRQIDPARIVSVNGGASTSGQARTQIYIVPAGATEPTAQP